MRIVKERLQGILPRVRVFLDVDDLKSGRGAEDVEWSCMVLCFLTKGYLESVNCVRELVRAVVCDIPIVSRTVCEEQEGLGHVRWPAPLSHPLWTLL